MNYKVLYRKYRPKNFDEVIGQDNNIKLLKEAITNDKISHAYIFSGPRGTGKTSTAKIFAKTINCLHSENGNPCGKCDNCLNVENSSDIFEIDAASNNGVDQIRELIDNIKLTPISSKYKVYIIDEVHMLSTSAFNALLLTLEEPPTHAIFILATTNIEEVPITVLSRCQRLDFKKISTNSLIHHIKEVATKENVDINDDAIKEIAEYSEGGCRDALSLLDQLSKLNCKIDLDIVLKSIGLISTERIKSFIEDINNNAFEKVGNFISNLNNEAIDYKTLIKKIISVLKTNAIDVKKGKKVQRLSYDDYKRMCFELSETLYKSNVNINSFDLFELIILSYMNREIKDNNMEIKPEKIPNKKVEQVTKNDESYFLGNKLIDVRINNCFVDANKESLKEAKENWRDFIKTIKNKKIKGLILDTDVVLASKEIYVIKVDLESSSDLINDNLEFINNEYIKLFDQNIKFISITSDRWEKEIEKYKENIRKGIKYNYEEEPKLENKVVNDIFSDKKIEIV